MKMILIILIFAINLIECIKVTDFCYKIKINDKKQECQGNYTFNIADIVCAKDRYSSRSLRVFYSIRNIQRNKNDYIYLKNKYEIFMNQIKDCPQPPKYKWNLNDVCLNSKDCLKTTLWRIWSTLLIPGECKCKGKHNYRCNNDYCALNKQACDGLNNQKSKKKIKKCIF